MVARAGFCPSLTCELYPGVYKRADMKARLHSLPSQYQSPKAAGGAPLRAVRSRMLEHVTQVAAGVRDWIRFLRS